MAAFTEWEDRTMTANRTEEQRIRDEYETNRQLVKDLETGALTYDDSLPVPELPKATENNVMVVKTFRLPMRLDEQLKAIAERRGVDVSALLRDWVAEMVAADSADVPVSLADVIRAVASLRPLPHAS